MRNLMKGLLVLTFMVVGVSQMNAQIYKNSIGVSIDLGDNATLAGPAFKHFFDRNNAVQAELLFGDHTTLLQAMYSYNMAIQGARGLNWYVGFGPAFAFYNDHDDHYGDSSDTDVAIRPMIGLEYRITQTPLAFSFDWRPAFWMTHGGGSNIGRFGLGIKFTF